MISKGLQLSTGHHVNNHSPKKSPTCCICPAAQIQLWHAEHIRGALELDARLKVVKSDPAIAQILGLSASDVNRKLLGRCVCPHTPVMSCTKCKVSAYKLAPHAVKNLVGGVATVPGVAAGDF